MKKRGVRNLCVAGILAIAVSGCGGASPERIAELSPDVPSAVALFADVCLANLPSLKNVEATALRKGLTPKKATRGIAGYRVPEKALFIATIDNTEGTACSVAFVGNYTTESIGEAFLNAAKRRTGGNPKQQLPTSFFEYAYQMRNGSILTYDRRQRGGAIRNVISISIPVSSQDVAKYIYN